MCNEQVCNEQVCNEQVCNEQVQTIYIYYICIYKLVDIYIYKHSYILNEFSSVLTKKGSYYKVQLQ